MQTIQKQLPGINSDNNSLKDAFDLFSKMSNQLEISYRILEQKVEYLTKQLAAENTDKLKQLAEKEKLADRIQALHSVMPAAVIWVDNNFKILSVNQMAVDIFDENITGKDWQELLNNKNFELSAQELIKDNKVYSYNHCAVESEQGYVIILTDVTLSRQLQGTNFRQQRLAEIGEITAGLSHQLRTPLASALLSLDHFQHPSADKDLQKKSLSRIKQNLHHIDQLVNDMLLFVRQGEFDTDQIDIHSLMHSIETNFSHHCSNRFTLSVINKIPQHILCSDLGLYGSQGALVSVITAVVENAIELKSDNKLINIRIIYEVDESVLLITIADDGPGLSPAECNEIFRPFYTTKEKGTGLGLAISKSIITAHHGTMFAKSDQQSGTEIQIRLRLHKNETQLASNINQYKKESALNIQVV